MDMIFLKELKSEFRESLRAWKWEKKQAEKLLDTVKYHTVAVKRIEQAKKEIWRFEVRLARIEEYLKKNKKGL